jgi:hypothetical protein
MSLDGEPGKRIWRGWRRGRGISRRDRKGREGRKITSTTDYKYQRMEKKRNSTRMVDGIVESE